MSADTLIQDPYDLQTYNRYAYVRNNPLKYTDPSGHSFWSIIAGIVIGALSFGIGTAIVGALQLTGMAAAVVGGAVMGFVGGFLGGIVNGLDPGDALLLGFKGALFGGISGAAAFQVAEYISSAFPGINGHAISLFSANKAIGYTAALTKAVMHGVVQGVIGMIRQGGKFLSSFASAFVSSAFSIGRNAFASLGKAAIAARTAIMALVGGVTSSLTGGKFLNGAVTAAFVHLFNTEAVWRMDDKIFSQEKIDEATANFRKKHPNVFSIMAHGVGDEGNKKSGLVEFIYGTTGTGIDFRYNEGKINTKFKQLLIDKGWNGKQDIVLFSCNAGYGGKSSYAYKLSKFLGVGVYAPTGYYRVIPIINYGYITDSTGIPSGKMSYFK